MLPDMLFNFVVNPPPVSSPYAAIMPSVVGIVGVVVGGLIAGGVNYYLARRKEIIDEKAKNESRVREVIVACRLVRMQLAEVGSSYTAIQQIGFRPMKGNMTTTLSLWPQYAAAIAHVSDGDEWDSLARTDMLLRTMDGRFTNPNDGGELTDDLRELVKSIEVLIASSQKTLGTIERREKKLLSTYPQVFPN